MSRLVPLFLLLLPLSLFADDSVIGLSRESVIRELGEPTGEMGDATRTKLYYPQGYVRLYKGICVESKFKSESEMAEIAERKEHERKVLEDYREQQRIKRLEQGEALLAQMKSDPNLLESPLDEQLAHWRAFEVEYPEVEGVGEILADLKVRYDAELAEARKQAEVAELKERLADAEERIADAEKKAADARKQGRSGFFYGYKTPAPVVLSPYYCSPTIVTDDSGVTFSYTGGGFTFSGNL